MGSARRMGWCLVGHLYERLFPFLSEVCSDAIFRCCANLAVVRERRERERAGGDDAMERAAAGSFPSDDHQHRQQQHVSERRQQRRVSSSVLRIPPPLQSAKQSSFYASARRPLIRQSLLLPSFSDLACVMSGYPASSSLPPRPAGLPNPPLRAADDRERPPPVERYLPIGHSPVARDERGLEFDPRDLRRDDTSRYRGGPYSDDGPQYRGMRDDLRDYDGQ